MGFHTFPKPAEVSWDRSWATAALVDPYAHEENGDVQAIYPYIPVSGKLISNKVLYRKRWARPVIMYNGSSNI